MKSQVLHTVWCTICGEAARGNLTLIPLSKSYKTEHFNRIINAFDYAPLIGEISHDYTFVRESDTNKCSYRVFRPRRLNPEPMLLPCLTIAPEDLFRRGTTCYRRILATNQPWASCFSSRTFCSWVRRSTRVVRVGNDQLSTNSDTKSAASPACEPLVFPPGLSARESVDQRGLSDRGTTSYRQILTTNQLRHQHVSRLYSLLNFLLVSPYMSGLIVEERNVTKVWKTYTSRGWLAYPRATSTKSATPTGIQQSAKPRKTKLTVLVILTSSMLCRTVVTLAFPPSGCRRFARRTSIRTR